MQISDTHTPLKPMQAPALENIRRVVQKDFELVNQLIITNLNGEAELTKKICHHIVNSGGKRLRPLLTLLSSKLLGYTGNLHLYFAVIIEFIHTATLLHDDVVDTSYMRRGVPTANSIWGTHAGILVGDFLYSRAFELMAECKNHTAIEVIAKTTNIIAQGEIFQLARKYDPTLNEDDYFQIVRGKTGVLFATAAELGAILTHAPADLQKAISLYGLHLGMAFQIADDCLDYVASPQQTGKNIGDDLAEGKVTLPLIYAMRHGTPQEAAQIETAIRQGGLENLATILTILESTQAIAYAKRCAQQHIDIAVENLQLMPNNPYKNALSDLAQFAVDRTG